MVEAGKNSLSSNIDPAFGDSRVEDLKEFVDHRQSGQ